MAPSRSTIPGSALSSSPDCGADTSAGSLYSQVTLYSLILAWPCLIQVCHVWQSDTLNKGLRRYFGAISTWNLTIYVLSYTLTQCGQQSLNLGNHDGHRQLCIGIFFYQSAVFWRIQTRIVKSKILTFCCPTDNNKTVLMEWKNKAIMICHLKSSFKVQQKKTPTTRLS